MAEIKWKEQNISSFTLGDSFATYWNRMSWWPVSGSTGGGHLYTYSREGMKMYFKTLQLRYHVAGTYDPEHYAVAPGWVRIFIFRVDDDAAIAAGTTTISDLFGAINPTLHTSFRHNMMKRKRVRILYTKTHIFNKNDKSFVYVKKRINLGFTAEWKSNDGGDMTKGMIWFCAQSNVADLFSMSYYYRLYASDIGGNNVVEATAIP